jgi:hypothetical protein
VSYSIKNGKLAKRKWNDGDVVVVDYGRDDDGRWWWRESDARTPRGRQPLDPDIHHGPFCTKAGAEKNSTDTLLGPQCKIEHGGMWDPAWDRPQ